MADKRPRPKLAVWKFASCDGCQLSILDCEDDLLTIADKLSFAFFLEASSEIADGPYDISFVEGSITTASDAQRIHEVRRQTKYLVTFGACATAGGIQGLRNFRDMPEMRAYVYAKPEYIDALATSTPIRDHVQVDFELWGCPPDKGQLLEVISAFLAGRAPNVPGHSVCVECKRKGNVCVMVTGTPCLGPITRSGCGSLCPSHARGCYGCFGPMETPNTRSLARAFLGVDVPERDLVRVLRHVNANAPAFREESDRHAK